MNHDTFDLRGWLSRCPSPPQTVDVSPALAAAILGVCKTLNKDIGRLVKGPAVKIIQAQFGDLWRPEINAPVVFSPDGVLLNGAHRLTAISKHYAPVPLTVAVCEDTPNTRASFDVCVRPRGLAVQIKAAGIDVPEFAGSSYSRGGVPVILAAANILHSGFYERPREPVTLPFYRTVLGPRYLHLFNVYPTAAHRGNGGDSITSRRRIPVDAWALLLAWEQADANSSSEFRARMWGEEARTGKDTVRAAMLWWSNETSKPAWDRTRLSGKQLVVGFARRLIDGYRAHCGGRAARKAPVAMKQVPIHGTKYIYWPGSTDTP